MVSVFVLSASVWLRRKKPGPRSILSGKYCAPARHEERHAEALDHMSELTIEPAKIVCLPGAILTRTALVIHETTTDDQLAEIGAALVSIDGSRCWWIGDYACALQRRKGEHYTDGRAEALGIEPGTFRQYKAVAAFFPPLSRAVNLTFAHHFEAMKGADGDLAVAQNWLDRAAKEEWSVSDLRKAVRLSKADPDYKDDGHEPTGNGYSALLDAVRFVHSQLKEIKSYTPEQAAAILSDIEQPFTTYISELRRLAAVDVA